MAEVKGNHILNNASLNNASGEGSGNRLRVESRIVHGEYKFDCFVA